MGEERKGAERGLIKGAEREDREKRKRQKEVEKTI